MSDIRFNQWLHNSGTGGVSQVDGGHVGIGTTNPLIPVGAGNTAILNVGVVTANSYYGSGANITGVTTASNFKTGSSNLHSTGLTVGNALVHSTGINVGTGATVHSPASNVLTLGTNSNERLRIDSSGRLLVGTGAAANPKSSGAGSIDLDNQAFSIMVGGNHPSGGRSNNNAKTFRMSMVHYTLAEEPINILQGYCDNSDNNVYIGGGTGSANSLTSVRIYTGANNTTTGGTERFRIHSAGQIGLSGANYGTSGQVLTSGGSGSAATWSTITGTTINNNANDRVITGSASANTLEGEANLTFETSTSGGTLTVAGTSEYQIKLKDSNTSGNGAETALAFTDSGNTIQGFVGYNYWGDGNLDIQNNNSGGNVCINTGGGNERLIITSDGDIYGPSAGRKNWFDNGSFDCTYGGRKANVSMDYGNHHAYGWVTDRFMSRNAVQWSRSSNVPTGKGFSYSTLTNGAGGILMQAVELPDYGDMGVFTPGSYWCVSFWSTATCNPSAAAFSYDLGSTKTDIIVSMSGAYTSTGETASGTSTGTFTRYYKVFQMPSSIISTATAAYWQWGFSQQGYTTGFQLERVPTSTSKPTPYEHVHPSVTIARCRRYAYRVYNSRHVTGWKRHDAGVHWEAKHPVLPTHMPSGSNQSADPYGVHMHSAGIFTNFQSNWQNPAVTSLGRYGFNPADGSFVLNGQSNYSGTHVVIPSWESFEYEIQHGFF